MQNMRKHLLVLSFLLLAACHEKVICPAFQSTYILDNSTGYAFYSYVWQLNELDREQFLSQMKKTTPDSSINPSSHLETDYYAHAEEHVVPWRVRKRNKYGIVRYEPRWLTNYYMKTAPMKNIFGPKSVETTTFIASSFSDSIANDSLIIASTMDTLKTAKTVVVAKNTEDKVRFLYKFDPKDRFNVEQEYYLKYFGEQLIDKRIQPASTSSDTPLHTKELSKDSAGGKKPFFKDLFRKKQNIADTVSDT